MALLWPESSVERASSSLRQVLLWLRRDLGEEVFLPEGAAGLRLDPGLVRSDLEGFRDALDSGMPEEAARLYRGPFLDGFNLPNAPEFTVWMEAQRDRLHRQYVLTLVGLARSAESEGRHLQAVAWRRRHAAADPYSSRAALGLLKALVAAGDRPGALEYAHVYENLVRQQLETDPDPTVLEFVGRLKDGTMEVPAPAPVVVPEATRRADPPADPADVPVAEGSALEEPGAAPVEPPIATDLPGESGDAVAPSGGSRPVRRLQLVAAVAVVGLLALAPTLWQLRAVDDGPLILASGAQRDGGRDVQTALIACEGPACPVGPLPQNAFVIPTHSSYTNPTAGSAYIAPVVDGMAVAPGYPCCTVAVFERVFQLPKDAVAGRIVASLLADNAASIAINGREFGRQEDTITAENFAGEPLVFSAPFAPDPSGINRVQLTLRDGGGALGLHYHIVVTYELADPESRR